MLDKPLIKFGSSELKALLAARHLMLDNDVAIIDRNKKFSFDNSFLFEGKSFDCGYHVVDLGRSIIYNDILFTLDLEWIKSPSNRSLVFNGKKYKRGYDHFELKDDFPIKNKNIFQDKFLSKLEKIYGSDFVKFSIDNIAESYVQNSLWTKDNLSGEHILTNIYPWFFPLISSDKEGNLNQLRPHFSNHMTNKKYVMYPKEGSFMSITESLRRSMKEILYKEDELDYQFANLDRNGKIDVEKNTYHVLPIDYIDVASKFNLEFPEYKESNFYLVSFILRKPLNFNDLEILVGDTDYYIDRVSSPDTLLGKKEVTCLQFECETLNEIDENELIGNIKSFMNKFLNRPSWDKYDVKKAIMKRYNTQGIDEKINKIIEFVESKNPQVIVLNRHILFNNLSESLEELITKIKKVAKL
jgi:hypothetical protein